MRAAFAISSVVVSQRLTSSPASPNIASQSQRSMGSGNSAVHVSSRTGHCAILERILRPRHHRQFESLFHYVHLPPSFTDKRCSAAPPLRLRPIPCVVLCFIFSVVSRDDMSNMLPTSPSSATPPGTTVSHVLMLIPALLLKPVSYGMNTSQFEDFDEATYVGE